MNQNIIDFAQDEFGDWFAILSCGHTRHMRHDPPWSNRPWVEHAIGREQFLGHVLHCNQCK